MAQSDLDNDGRSLVVSTQHIVPSFLVPKEKKKLIDAGVTFCW